MSRTHASSLLAGGSTSSDIRAVVECGCPNVFRKAVNSAKRLRAFLQVDERDVCSTCNLRESCGKAYMTPYDDRGHTLDVVRILLSYAVNPKHLCGEEISCIKEHVQNEAFYSKRTISKGHW
ncbi:uncharacterized protein LOC135614514 isoform X3 [Musa acuminata AAA Group]|uniref:uncharacterized protein LOC135614514 isoform X3 n=1 Tax=Musa acuminata AAA Group TaxID=214697 RepID=UPI0031DBD2BD